MKIPKSIWIVLLWIIILVGLFVFQNQKLQSGEEIWVKPVPVDPRDLFRGDYVIFSYDFSTFRTSAMEEPMPNELNRVVYALLKNDGSSFVLDRFTLTKPAKDSIFLKGFTPGGLYDGAQVTYNLESYFVPEGTGKKFEEAIGKNLMVRIHVNPNGEAFIKGTNINEITK